MKKALILGGYGNFGRRISQALLKANIPITIAGRNIDKATQMHSHLANKYNPQLIDSARVDVEEGISKILNNHHVVVNTCGPFQQANYIVVQDCIKNKVNYVDLADGRDFVTGMSKFDEKAKQAGIVVIPGASSVPGLSSAIIEKYKSDLSEIDSVEYGISPGQKTTRGGLATVKGVMSYIGKPIRPYVGFDQPLFGWQDLYRQRYPEIGYRLMGNCEVPDLDLLPTKYNIKKLRFSAGMEADILHLGIWGVSWLIRAGVPINLPKYAKSLLNFSHWGFDWMGTDAGGLHMSIEGKDHQNKPYRRKWYIIIKNGDGPNVPIAPAIILARKLCESSFGLKGVQPCVGLVSLEEYVSELEQYSPKIYTYKY